MWPIDVINILKATNHPMVMNKTKVNLVRVKAKCWLNGLARHIRHEIAFTAEQKTVESVWLSCQEFLGNKLRYTHFI